MLSVKRLATKQLWSCPQIISSVGGKIRIPNLSSEPQSLKRNEHFCQIRSVYSPEVSASNNQDPVSTPIKPRENQQKYSSNVRLDPDNLFPPDVKTMFDSLMTLYDDVFNPSIKGYNGAIGPFEAKVNMGPVETPQRKGRLPQYGRPLNCKKSLMPWRH